MIRRVLCLVALLLPATVTLAAQAAKGDSAWAAGKFGDAQAAYERELTTNPGSVRSLYRLGVLASWRGDLDSALVLAARARAVEPGDTDVLLLEAQVLAWKGDLDGSLARYDSIIAANPGNAGAITGRARIRAWQGDFAGAEAGYRRALSLDSTNADARVGLAQVHFWQGHAALARAELRPVLAADPGNRDAKLLDQAIRLARQSLVEASGGWNHDSDHNTSWWQSLQATMPLSDVLTVFGSVGLQQSKDPVRRANRQKTEAGLRLALGKVGLTAAAGVRRLAPDGGSSRTAASYRGSVSLRPMPRVAVSGGFAHYSLDETALLIESGLDVDEAEGAVDLGVTPTTTISAGGGGAWLSDDNRRYHVLATITQELPLHFFMGGYARQMGYDFKGTGYFSPDRFRILEGRGGWSHESRRWLVRVAGGLGAQQAFRGAETQAEWHADGTAGRKWGMGNSVVLFGGLSNSLEGSVAGAYRYRNAGLRVTLGL